MPGMIVAPQPTAVEEGAKVLKMGGNAVDAAVTAAFVQFVIDPHSCSAGGYMVVNFHRAGGETPLLLDGPAVAGSRVTPGASSPWWVKKGGRSPIRIDTSLGKLNALTWSAVTTAVFVFAVSVAVAVAISAAGVTITVLTVSTIIPVAAVPIFVF